MADGPANAHVPSPNGATGHPVNRWSGVPLHVQFREHLLDQIEDGTLPPGAQLPREKDLADRHGMSVAPIRQAMLELVKGGFLERTRGRGTFVRERRVADQKLAILSSFTESMRAAGFETEVTVRRNAVVRPSAAERAALGAVGDHPGELVLIERDALVDGEPVAALEAYLPLDLFPFLPAEDLGGRSLYALLEQRAGTRVTRAESVVEVVRCTRHDAERLGVARGTAALSVAGVTFDHEDRAIEWSRVLYREERFRFEFNSYRGRDGVMHIVASGGSIGEEG